MSIKTFIFFIAIFILHTSTLNAQDSYWISFTDKNNTKYSIATPEEYLSERAIERRTRQNISIDTLDLPVNENYVDSVLNLGAELVHKSKWLNGITIISELDSFPQEVMKLPFVSGIQLTKPKSATKSAKSKFNELTGIDFAPIDSSEYGRSVYQTGLMNGQFLHNQNYNGQGMQIAVIDGGFFKADEYIAFDSLWANNQILGTKDFVEPGSDIFGTNFHGMSVLSCMGGNVPGELIGTSRKASFWLLRTEDNPTEYLIEEDNWVAAAEFADSVGVDIINSSLGYYEFHDTLMNHTYSDMDGKTTRVSIGANIAATRGMLVFTSAGNEGNKAWKYIIAPADAENVIAVGATNKFGFTAPFTSFGPAYSGEIKPNVAGVGWNTYLQLSNGNFGYSNGTSYSSPVVAGMAACLWQAVPNATSLEIKTALEVSSSLYNQPDSKLGYGIPDFKKAWLLLTNQSSNEIKTNNWLVYPNPVQNYLIIEPQNSTLENELRIEIYTIDGRLLQHYVKPTNSRIIFNDFHGLPNGLILVKIISENTTETFKILKQQ